MGSAQTSCRQAPIPQQPHTDPSGYAIFTLFGSQKQRSTTLFPSMSWKLLQWKERRKKKKKRSKVTEEETGRLRRIQVNAPEWKEVRDGFGYSLNAADHKVSQSFRLSSRWDPALPLASAAARTTRTPPPHHAHQLISPSSMQQSSCKKLFQLSLIMS